MDVVVPRRDWSPAIQALQPLALDGERMGMPDEPEPGALIRTREGPFIEVFPQGITAGQIASLRGKYRPHPSQNSQLTLRGDPLVGLINSNLASYLCATDRLKDLAGVQELVKKLNLNPSFAQRLDSSVRAQFRMLFGRI